MNDKPLITSGVLSKQSDTGYSHTVQQFLAWVPQILPTLSKDYLSSNSVANEQRITEFYRRPIFFLCPTDKRSFSEALDAAYAAVRNSIVPLRRVLPPMQVIDLSISPLEPESEADYMVRHHGCLLILNVPKFVNDPLTNRIRGSLMYRAANGPNATVVVGELDKYDLKNPTVLGEDKIIQPVRKLKT